MGRGEPNLAAVLAIILLFGLAVAAVTTAVYFKSIQEKKMSQVRNICFLNQHCFSHRATGIF